MRTHILKKATFGLAVLGAVTLGSLTQNARALLIENETGLGTKISDGGGDVYDFFGELRINGENYNADVFTNTDNSVLTFYSEKTGGATVAGQIKTFEQTGVVGLRKDYRFIRWWYQITNPTLVTQEYTVTWGGDLGSDSATVLRDSASVSGSDAPYRWIITEPSTLVSPDDDPTLGTVFSSAVGAEQPSATTVTGLSTPNLLATYTIRVAPLSSVSLVFFGSARVAGGSGRDGRGRLSDAQADIKSTLLDANGNVKAAYLADGLTTTSRILNQVAANADQFPTTVYVKSSAPKFRNGKVSLSGTAYAAYGIREVRVQVGKSRLKAKGTNYWSLAGRIRGKGSIPVTVQAFDTRGVGSTVAKYRLRVR